MHREHPAHSFLYSDVFPTVWCSGCGIGTVLSSFIEAAREYGVSPGAFSVISGTGCAGKIAECLKTDSSSASNGYVADKAVKIIKESPRRPAAAFLNNADLLLSGGEDWARAGKSRVDMTLIHINNFVCAVSRDRIQPLTPFMRRSQNGLIDLPFNIPQLAVSAGAVYVARWTPIRAGWLKHSFLESFSRTGLSVIEVISPCVIYDAVSRRLLDPAERMKFYCDRTILADGEDLNKLDIRNPAGIIIGKFVDIAEESS